MAVKVIVPVPEMLDYSPSRKRTRHSDEASMAQLKRAGTVHVGWEAH